MGVWEGSRRPEFKQDTHLTNVWQSYHFTIPSVWWERFLSCLIMQPGTSIGWHRLNELDLFHRFQPCLSCCQCVGSGMLHGSVWSVLSYIQHPTQQNVYVLGVAAGCEVEFGRLPNLTNTNHDNFYQKYLRSTKSTSANIFVYSEFW